jgi:hypothetical protein
MIRATVAKEAGQGVSLLKKRLSTRIKYQSLFPGINLTTAAGQGTCRAAIRHPVTQAYSGNAGRSRQTPNRPLPTRIPHGITPDLNYKERNDLVANRFRLVVKPAFILVTERRPGADHRQQLRDKPVNHPASLRLNDGCLVPASRRRLFKAALSRHVSTRNHANDFEKSRLRMQAFFVICSFSQNAVCLYTGRPAFGIWTLQTVTGCGAGRMLFRRPWHGGMPRGRASGKADWVQLVKSLWLSMNSCWRRKTRC